MLNRLNLLGVLGLASVAVITVMKSCANRQQRVDVRLHRKALQRWEGEGGNIIQPTMPSAKAETRAPDVAS